MKDFMCKSTVRGNIKYVVFSNPSTRCFRFGFHIRRLKNKGVRIRVRFPNHYLSRTVLPPYLYKEMITLLKKDCKERFGGNQK